MRKLKVVSCILGCIFALRCYGAEKLLSDTKSALGGSEAKSEKGLVAYWSFDEGKGDLAKDKTGNKNDGEVVDAEWVKGKIGSALQFDGGSSQVDCGLKEILNAKDALTILAWVKPAQNEKLASIVSKDSYKGNQGYLLFQRQNKFFFRVCDGNKVYDAEIEPMVEPEKWYHLAGVFDGKKVSLYVNGELKKSGPAEIKMAPAQEAFLIGSRATVSGQIFNGIIDEVKIYNRALIEDEIKSDYKLGEEKTKQ